MVLGFLFSEDMSRVALIEKKRPEWQKGKLNGIGGKAEANENPLFAITREFLEETGVEIAQSNWQPFCYLTGTNWIVDCFYTKSSKIDEIKTTTDEEVKEIFVDELKEFDHLSNLDWLIPLAINHNKDSTLNFGDVFYNQ